MQVVSESPSREIVDTGNPHKWLILVAIGLGASMSGVDASVVNTVLPVITSALRTDVTTAEWVVTVYLVLLSGLLLTFGRLGDLRGHRTTYLVGYGLFLATSAACAFAPTVQVLIAERCAQALGAAMLTSNAPAILTSAFPARERGSALGWYSMSAYVGLALGPSLGGWLADSFGWGAIFFINVPAGALAFLISLRYVPKDTHARGSEGFDLPGALLYTSGLILLLLALNQGHDWGWTSPLLVACAAAAAALLAFFVVVERRSAHPMLDLSLFRNRVFSSAVASGILNFMGSFSLLFLVPFYLLDGRGLTPSQAGLLLASLSIVTILMAPFSGVISDRIGARLPATLGMVLQAAGLLLLAQMDQQTPYLYIAACLALVGIGIGLFTAPNNSAIIGSAPPARRGIASAIIGTVRNSGTVLGIGVTGAILTTSVARAADPTSPAAVIQAVDTGLVAAAALSTIGAFLSATRESPTERASTG